MSAFWTAAVLSQRELASDVPRPELPHSVSVVQAAERNERTPDDRSPGLLSTRQFAVAGAMIAAILASAIYLASRYLIW